MNDDTLDLIKELSPEKRALVLKALKEKALDALDPPITPQEAVDGLIPLSFSQERLWLLEQLQPESRAYNELCALRAHGTLDDTTIEKCFTEITRRHQALRTVFPEINGNPVQMITPPHPVRFLHIDLSKLTKAEQESEFERLTYEESRYSFDLSRGPLLRVTLVHLDEQDNILLIAAHHIVLDGWSIGIFRRELEELYEAFRKGRPSPLPELTVQYTDYAIWQRNWLQQEDLESQLRYWTRQLKDLPEALQLPVANRRPENVSFQGARQYFKLSPKLTVEIKSLAMRENVTLFMTLLTGFLILLHRYSSQTDIPVGTAVANRQRAEVEGLIGFFVNTLVMRGNLAGNPTPRELLRRVSDVAISAYEHRDLPFDHVVAALQPTRSSNHHPLFQVVFDLQNTPKHTRGKSRSSFSSMEVTSVPARFDLILSMEDTPEGLQAYWQYNTGLFEPDAITRMSGHLETLLKGMVANPDQSITRLPLLTDEEKRQVLIEWNQTHTASHFQDIGIHRLFEAQAGRTPDAIAVSCAGHSLAYRELNRRANQIARHLLELGIRTGDMVGICMQRSVDIIAAPLGVLKAGAAYVPLDPSAPQEHRNHILSDAKPVAILTHQSLAAELSSGTLHVICLDSEIVQSDSGPDDDPPILATADSLAYVIYTSGSTGLPKGVMISHRNLVHSTLARREYYSEPVTSFLLLPSFSFDSSVAGIYWTLSQGGTLVIPDETQLLDMTELRGLISLWQVSHLLCIPSIYTAILEKAQQPVLSSLKIAIVAGEPCTKRLIEDHHRQAGHAALFNEYGPTEATVWSTVFKCDSPPPRNQVPVGRPISNTQIYLLDAQLQPVPVGVPAELHIAGTGISPGYLNRPALSAEKFIPAPFSDHTACSPRLYKTGDIARYRPDGNIELLGRMDQQVKIRGFRIEIGEIEAALSQYEAVRDAVVAAHEEEEGNKKLVAYLTVHSTPPFSIPELRKFLTKQLPTYALPSQFDILDSLPRLYNGKVDRLNLPIPQMANSGSVESVATWLSDLEQSIADIWKETLQVDSVCRQDNFFEIGGDSLSIIRVYNRLRGVTDKHLAITDLFKHPTLDALAQYIESRPVVGKL